MRYGTPVTDPIETPRAMPRLVSVFKRDHPRHIDRLIDYFGSSTSTADTANASWTEGAKGRSG